MSILKYIIGYIASKLKACECYYRIHNYKRLINGQGYFLNGNVHMTHPENISIGERTYINGGDLSASPNAKIVIGADCLISYSFFARTDSHNFKKKMNV